MAWTNQQKKVAAMAARAAKLSDEHRRLILQQLPRAIHGGRPTSTSPRLSNGDFEIYMSQIEHFAGGQILGYDRNHWHRMVTSQLDRTRHRIREMAEPIVEAGHLNMEGFIRRMTGGDKNELEQLDAAEIYKVIEGIKGIAKRLGVRTG